MTKKNLSTKREIKGSSLIFNNPSVEEEESFKLTLKTRAERNKKKLEKEEKENSKESQK
jgi:hypothetical protein